MIKKHVKILISILGALPTISDAQYLQAGASYYKLDANTARVVSAAYGGVYGPIDANITLNDTTVTSHRGATQWTGYGANITAHKVVIDGSAPVTAWIGYQLNQLPDKRLNGRYGLGLTIHNDPVKVSMVYSPKQSDLIPGPKYDAVGFVLNFRHELGK